MKNIIKIILFVSLIAAMILPFSRTQMADAQISNKEVTIGKTIIKDKARYKSMPTIKDVETKLKESGFTKKEIGDMDIKQLYCDKHQEWLLEHKDLQKEQAARKKQVLLAETVIKKSQNKDQTQQNYLPWASIGYDCQDNALEITMGTDSIYVKHERFTSFFRGLTWDF